MNNITCLEWAEALRSGKYKQCRKVLHNREEFCCLGVYCDLVDSQKWNDLGEWISTLGTHYGTPPDEVIDYNVSVHFYNLNDAENWTFEQIAQEIEDLYHAGKLLDGPPIHFLEGVLIESAGFGTFILSLDKTP